MQPQIHIIFNCPEDRRITEPLLQYNPDKIYYFTAFIYSTGQSDEHMDFFRKNIEIIRTHLPNVEIIQKQADYTDYINVIQEISKIIKEERERAPQTQIYFNLGSGSKITALASAEASKLWNCKSYYVHSTKYNPKADARHTGEMIIKEAINFPIRKPKRRLLEVLKIIKEMIDKRYEGKQKSESGKFIYKKALLEKLKETNHLKLIKSNENLRFKTSSYYMKLNQNYLRPLEEELKFIKVSKDKRNKKIFITSKGNDVLGIFQNLI